MEIRTYREGEGDKLRTFWLACGIHIRPGDDDRALARFAARNEDLALLAIDGGRIVGSALAGWDGRRGWLHHVATHPDERRHGIGRTLVETLETRLRALGCPKVNLLVNDGNTWGMSFWEAVGYKREKTVEFGKEL